MTASAPCVSVIVVTSNRVPELRACADSLRAQPQPDLEIILVLNGATEAVRKHAAAVVALDPRFSTLACSRRSASGARNLAAARARGPLFYFLDDDIELAPNGIETLLRVAAETPEVEIIGGPNLTPPDDPPFAQLAGQVLASPWGSGPTSARYRPEASGSATERDLILCNMAVRREVFDRGLHFPDRYFGGEENVLMGHVGDSGGAMSYTPDLWVYHRRRATLLGHVEQMYRYGRGRAVAILWAPRTRHPAFFAPLALMLYLAALPVLAWLQLPGWWAPAIIYGAGTLLFAGAVARRNRELLWWPMASLLFPLTHLAYGAGLAVTLLLLPDAGYFGVATSTGPRDGRTAPAVMRARGATWAEGGLLFLLAALAMLCELALHELLRLCDPSVHGWVPVVAATGAVVTGAAGVLALRAQLLPRRRHAVTAICLAALVVLFSGWFVDVGLTVRVGLAALLFVGFGVAMAATLVCSQLPRLHLGLPLVGGAAIAAAAVPHLLPLLGLERLMVAILALLGLGLLRWSLPLGRRPVLLALLLLALLFSQVGQLLRPHPCAARQGVTARLCSGEDGPRDAGGREDERR